MRKKKKDEYHLLVAQNFLGNISLTGKHDDTNLRIFNSPGYTSVIKKNGKTLSPSKYQREISGSSIDRTFGLRDHGEEDSFSRSYPTNSFSTFFKHKKAPQSLIHRFSKILSSDDVMSSRESRLEQEHQPLTTRSVKDEKRRRCDSTDSAGITDSQSIIFRIIRTSIAKGERHFLCGMSTRVPFFVVSNFNFNNHDRHRLNRSHSTLATSMDRLRHFSQCSLDELKPYDFPDEETEISYGHFFGRKRGISPCGAICGIRRSDRRDSQYVDSFTKMTDGEASDTLGTMLSLAMRDNEFTDEIEWDDENYSPSVFEDIEAGRKTIIKGMRNGNPAFIAVTLESAGTEYMKASLNQTFVDKFPRVNLTFSKFKSIKEEMIYISKTGKLDLDPGTTAQAIIYYEKIVHKALISKNNRKVVAGTSLLIAMKLNDYSKENIKLLIETVTEKLRVSRKDLLALEIPFCAALHFDLRPKPEHINALYQKLLIAAI